MKGNFFQLIILIVFIAGAILGILVFSGAIPLGNDTAGTTGAGTVVVWGTVKSDAVSPLLEEFNAVNPTFVVKYVQRSANTFDQDLLEALATNSGPDILFLPDDLAFHYSNKIFTFPYTSYPLATFKNNFAGAGGVFLTSRGMLAFPLAIDPLVMYYNRSVLDANSIVYPPANWNELVDMVPKLTKKDDTNKILKSTVALGHFSNIAHAKDILSALFMQVGSPIVTENNGTFGSGLADTGRNLSPILSFYTDFANPLKDIYSWNKSFQNSRDAFSAENTAFYFGYASELNSLINKNPNQNFLVAPFPQLKGSNLKITGGRVLGVAVTSSSKNFNTAYLAASQMATGRFAAQFANALRIAPARLDLLANKPVDAYMPIFYNSALYAHSWLDPSSRDTDDIFRNMIDGVLSNTMTPPNAIDDASSKLNLLLLR